MSQEIDQIQKPVIGFTMGDVNGVGPEILLKLLVDNKINKLCVPIVYGSSKVLHKYKKQGVTEEIHFQYIKSPDQAHTKKNNLINVWEEDYAIEPGKETEIGGKLALLSLQAAADDLKKGLLDGIVTAPINKKNIQSEAFKFPGHTEFFEYNFARNEGDSLMFLVAEGLRVAVVTGHIPVNEVAQKLNQELITHKLKTIIASLKNDFGIQKPKVAVLGLNPHAGDNGLMGKEEQEIITPVIETFKNQGQLVFGPYPADGFFGAKTYAKYDAVLAMYHDQGLIPFKALAMENGVNFTAGLPIVRTSPDHGTAFDIAGKNKADESSIREALYVALDVIKSRKTLLVVKGV